MVPQASRAEPGVLIWSDDEIVQNFDALQWYRDASTTQQREVDDSTALNKLPALATTRSGRLNTRSVITKMRDRRLLFVDDDTAPSLTAAQHGFTGFVH